MSKITEDEKSFIQLMKRSDPDADGWYQVSKMLWPLVVRFRNPDLIEEEPHEDGTGRIRFTDKGKVVAEYIA